MEQNKVNSEVVNEIEMALEKMEQGKIEGEVIPLDACSCTGNLWSENWY